MKYNVGDKINNWVVISDEIIHNNISHQMLRCGCGSEELRRVERIKDVNMGKSCNKCAQLNRKDRKYHIGLTLKNLTIIDIVREKDLPIKYLVRCSCGNEFLCGHTTLNYKLSDSGKRSTLPYCANCFKMSAKKKKACLMLTKDISKIIYEVIKRSAGRRGILFDVTPEYLQNIFDKQNHKCIYSDLDLNINESLAKFESRIKNTASLDRIDSNLGYIVGNVQWVHKDVNLIKHTFNHDGFIKIVSLIANRF